MVTYSYFRFDANDDEDDVQCQWEYKVFMVVADGPVAVDATIFATTMMTQAGRRHQSGPGY